MSPWQTDPWQHRAGEHAWSLSVSQYGTDTQADEDNREVTMTHEADDITNPKPPIGAARRYTNPEGVDTLGIVVNHPGAFPQLVTLRTEQRHLSVLAYPGTLRPTTPADDWDVHVLQALVTVTPST